MTEKSCARCGRCCMVLPLFTQHMHPDFRKYLLNRGLQEDKEQGCILIPNVCQHLKKQVIVNVSPMTKAIIRAGPPRLLCTNTTDEEYAQGIKNLNEIEIPDKDWIEIGLDEERRGEIRYLCDIHDDPDRPHVCRLFHGQKMIKGSRIYVPPECTFNREG